MSQHQRKRAKSAVSVIAAVAIAGVLVMAGSTPAMALSSDQSEAEGRVLSGGGAINLNDIASLAPAYSANPSAPGDSTNPLDATVLNALNLDLGNGIQLFGPAGVIGVGALGQHASTGADGAAYASSGAVNSDGSIAVGGGGGSDNAYIDLTQLLDNAGLGGATDGLISQLRVEVGALTATAASDAGGTATGDYQIANGKLTFVSPAIATLTGSLSDELGTVSGNVNGITGTDGALGSALSGIADDLVSPLADALGTVSGGLVNVSNVGLTASLNVDLKTALSSITSAPITSADSAVTIDFSTGQISVDLARLIADSQGGTYDGTLNGLAPNTQLLDPDLIKAGLDGAIGSILDQIPALIVNAATDTLNSTELQLHLTADAGVTLPIVGTVPLANIDVLVDGTLGGFLGVSGSDAPTFDASGTKALGGLVPVGTLITPIVNTLSSVLLPAIVTPLSDAITGAGLLDTAFRPIVTVASDTLKPLAAVLNNIVSLTANVQETSGEFTTPGADSTGSFTERALSVTLLPVLSTPLAQVNLASATVRAGALDVAPPIITAPADGAVIDVPDADGTTDVDVSGTGIPTATVNVSIPGQTDQTAVVDGDGNWTVTYPALPVDDYEVTATQTLGGTTSDPATSTFSIAPTATSTSTSTTPGDSTSTSTSTSTSPGDSTSTSTSTTPGDSTSTSTSTTPGDSTSTSTSTSTTPGDSTSTTTSTTPGDSTSTSTSTSTSPGDSTSTTTSTTPGDSTSTSTSTTPGDSTSTTTSTSTTPGDSTSTSTSTTPGDSTSTSTSTTPGDSTSTTTSTSTTPGDSTSTSTSTTPGDSTSASTSTSTSTSTSATSGDSTSTSTSTGDGPSSSVKYTTIVRGTGVTQVIYGTGFNPGESVSGTLHSTPTALAAKAADASGNVSWSVSIDSTFQVGQHSASLTGATSGPVSQDRNHTQFAVTVAAASGDTSGGDTGSTLARTGTELGWPLLAALVALLAGAGILVIRRKRTSQS